MKIGERAYDFSLPDKTGKLISLKDFSARFLVLYFYPKDNTPGCSIEAQDFQKKLADLKSQEIDVVGISGGDDDSKTKFCDKYDLTFPLLSDEDFSVSKKYGSYGRKSFMGKLFLGILRQTFVFNQARECVLEYPTVKVQGHVEQVSSDIKALSEFGCKVGTCAGLDGDS